MDKISMTDVGKNEIFFEIKISKVFIRNRKEVCDIYSAIDKQLKKLWKLRHLSWKEYEKWLAKKNG